MILPCCPSAWLTKPALSNGADVEVEIGGCTERRASFELTDRDTLNTDIRARWLASALVALAGWCDALWTGGLHDLVDDGTAETAESGSWPFPKVASMT